MKSCELTGIWEKKLRDIEHKKYDAAQFVEELKAQITEIVRDVLTDNTNRRVTVLTEEDLKKKPAARTKKKEKTPDTNSVESPILNQQCPLCGKGIIIKGKTAYGCSRWREGCNWRKPF